MKYIFPVLILLLSLLIGCGGGDDSQTQTQAPQTKSKPPQSPGQIVYNTHCVACHLKTGKGIAGVYPPLIKTKWVSGDKATLINTVLKGMKGEIVVLGETYNNVMQPYASVLSDEEIANVLTYVRNSFGNNYPAITPAEVAAERAKLKES